jgi:hypothetical protein
MRTDVRAGFSLPTERHPRRDVSHVETNRTPAHTVRRDRLRVETRFAPGQTADILDRGAAVQIVRVQLAASGTRLR